MESTPQRHALPKEDTTRHPSLTVAFYNTENLFDTLPSPDGRDGDYTPQGRLHWTSERYRHKIANLARVIDDMGADIVGLCEVENEGVVRGLALATAGGYACIHRETSDPRGIDIALLYRPDRFFPTLTEQLPVEGGREILHVSGTWDGLRVELLVCHAPSQMNSVAQRAQALETLAQHAAEIVAAGGCNLLIVMGDMNASPESRPFRRAFGSAGPDGRLSGGLWAPFGKEFRKAGGEGGRAGGSYSYGGSWSQIDNMLLHTPAPDRPEVECGVFVRDYMLRRDNGTGSSANGGNTVGTPLRSYSKGRYTGGFSDHLPIILKYTR